MSVPSLSVSPRDLLGNCHEPSRYSLKDVRRDCLCVLLVLGLLPVLCLLLRGAGLLSNLPLKVGVRPARWLPDAGIGTPSTGPNARTSSAGIRMNRSSPFVCYEG